jgi:hypothetical protein
MPVHAAATQRQRSCWIAIEPPSFFSFLCTCTKYNNSSERTSNPVLKSKTTRPLPCQNAVMRPSRIFGSLTPSREGSRLTSTHLHAGFTRESDVRRESDVKRNIASRVRAHASRLSQTWGVSRKFASRHVGDPVGDYLGGAEKLNWRHFHSVVHSTETKNIKYSTKFTTISWFFLNSFFNRFF